VVISSLWVREVSLDNQVLVFSEEVWNDEVLWWMHLHSLLNTSRLHDLMGSPVRSDGQPHEIWTDQAPSPLLRDHSNLMSIGCCPQHACDRGDSVPGRAGQDQFSPHILFWPHDGSCSFVFSYSVISEGTEGVPSHWSVRKFPVALLGEFRSHTWVHLRSR
jgi:hypothetical protein